MKILNLLATGKSGGIETLCNNIDKYSNEENYWIFLFLGGEIADEMLKRNPNKTFYFGFNKLNFFKYLISINNIIKKYNIEIVTIHHGGTYCNLLFYLLMKMNKKVKFVRYLHSCYEDDTYLKNKYFADKMAILFIRKTLLNSDLIISVSNAVQCSFEKKFNLNKKNKVVIYNGIDRCFFESPLSKKNIECNSVKQIIYVGRLVRVKGVHLLIEAVNKIIKEYKINVTLKIIGDGVEKENLEKLVSELGINDSIEFLGTKNNVIDYLDKADVFVYPSTWQEAFGISVVEAMARGCIPLVSNRGGLPEVVNYNNYNLFNNIEELTSKLIEILDDKNNYNLSNISECRKQAEIFAIDNTIKKLRQAYKLLKN